MCILVQFFQVFICFDKELTLHFQEKISTAYNNISFIFVERLNLYYVYS